MSVIASFVVSEVYFDVWMLSLYSAIVIMCCIFLLNICKSGNRHKMADSLMTFICNSRIKHILKYIFVPKMLSLHSKINIVHANAL